MTRSLRRWVALVAVGVLGLVGLVSSAASGGDQSREFSAHLSGYEEVPAVSTAATGRFRAKVNSTGDLVRWRLHWSGLEGSPLQAHLHLGQFSANGGISVFLCSNLTGTSAPPAGTPTCPADGRLSGQFGASGVVGPSGQGLSAGELSELLRAMRAGVVYANVHSSLVPSGEIRGQLDDEDDDD